MARKPLAHDDTPMDIHDIADYLRLDSTSQAYATMRASGVKPIAWPGRRRWWKNEVIAWLSRGRQEVVRQEPVEQVKQPKRKKGEPDLSMIGAWR